MDWKSERNSTAKQNKERVGGEQVSFTIKKIELKSVPKSILSFDFNWCSSNECGGWHKSVFVPIIISRGASESILFDFFSLHHCSDCHCIWMRLKKKLRVLKNEPKTRKKSKKNYWMAWFWIWSHAIQYKNVNKIYW